MSTSLLEELKVPLDGRIYNIEKALSWGATVEQVHEATGIDPWFLDQIDLIREHRQRGAGRRRAHGPELLRNAKHYGLSDLPDQPCCGRSLGSEKAVREFRWAQRHSPGVQDR